MEQRKLIKFGNSSFVISLPSYWIKKNELKKGNNVFFEENSEGNLIITPSIEEKSDVEKIKINIKSKDSVEQVSRKLVSAYIKGYNVIQISYSKDFDEKKLKEIKNIITGLVALEITEQTNETIKVREFLDINKVSLQDIIRRMDIIIKSMFEKSRSSFSYKNYNELLDRDKEVNKLYHLSFRVIRKAFMNPQIFRSLNVNHLDLFIIWRIVANMEKIADEIKRTSRYLTEETIDKKIVDRFLDLYVKVEEHYNKVMKAHYKNDTMLAYEVADQNRLLIKECNELSNSTSNNRSVIKICEKLKALVSYHKTIARSVYT